MKNNNAGNVTGSISWSVFLSDWKKRYKSAGFPDFRMLNMLYRLIII